MKSHHAVAVVDGGDNLLEEPAGLGFRKPLARLAFDEVEQVAARHVL